MRNRENQDFRETQIIKDNPIRFKYFLKLINDVVDKFGVELAYTSNIESIIRLSSEIGYDPALTATHIIGSAGQVCYRKARCEVLYSDVNRPISTELRNKYMAIKQS